MYRRAELMRADLRRDLLALLELQLSLLLELQLTSLASTSQWLLLPQLLPLLLDADVVGRNGPLLRSPCLLAFPTALLISL